MPDEDRSDDVEREWLGGRYVFPGPGGPGALSGDAAAILWIELPEKTIVTISVITAENPVSIAESFDQARYMPDDDEPREPTRIRVGNEQFARELRAVAGEIPITVAPVPELDTAFEGVVNAIRLVNAPRSEYGGDFLPPPVPARAPVAGRNDPWPCGSGRKYKKCHL